MSITRTIILPAGGNRANMSIEAELASKPEGFMSSEKTADAAKTDVAREFTEQQLLDWKAYERVRRSGEFNMFDSRARRRSGLSADEYTFVMRNYSALKHAVEG